jgi:hypothetical protein
MAKPRHLNRTVEDVGVRHIAHRDQHLIGVQREHPVDGRPAYAERGRDTVRRVTAGVHPLRQSRFGIVQRFGATNCPARHTCRCAPFRAQLNLGQVARLSRVTRTSDARRSVSV